MGFNLGFKGLNRSMWRHNAIIQCASGNVLTAIQ